MNFDQWLNITEEDHVREAELEDEHARLAKRERDHDAWLMSEGADYLFGGGEEI